MISSEGESYDFHEPQKPEGQVEGWLNLVEQEMYSSLRRITKEAIYHYAKKERTKWVIDNIGMTVIVATQVWWTWKVEDVFNKVKKGDKYAMKNEEKKQTFDLNDLITMIRQPGLVKVNRKKINTLIIMDVHARDIVSLFVRDSILDAKEF